jgi:hypothetical protein
MAGFLAHSMSKPWHDTRHAAVQKNSGIGVAETGESVTPGKMRKRKRGTVSELHPRNITLGAVRRGVKQYSIRTRIDQ